MPIKTLMETFCHMTIKVEMISTIITSQNNSLLFWMSLNIQ